MADKIKKFLTDNKGCPLTPAATKQLFVKFLEFLVKEGYGEELESLKSGGIQYGSYLYFGEPDRFEFYPPDKSYPEDYSGFSIGIDESGIYVAYYSNGVGDISSVFSPYGVDRVQPEALVNLTHSFNELDPVLKQIVDDAIADSDQNGVACTLAQWNDIKQLLDKSLFISYQGYSMIKTSTDGISIYTFGCQDGAGSYGASLSLHYVESDILLYGLYTQL